MTKIKITVVTATLNAARYLPRLVASLRAQTDSDFDWVVADGCSTDGTADIARSSGVRVQVLERRDFGIYDALNNGVRQLLGGYYLVVGADDTLRPDAIEQFKAAVLTNNAPDFIAASIVQEGKLITAKKGWGWLYGLPGVATSHAVGLLINAEVHQRFGFYSHKLPIAADQLFVKTALGRGASIAHVDFVAGEFGTDGTSGQDSLGVITELLRVQVATERHKGLQCAIFIARLLKLYFRGGLTRR